MNLRRKIFLLFYPSFILILLALTQSCSIKEPTAPNWDVSLNVPITTKSYTLFDIIEKKSSTVQHYTSGSSTNILYYTTTEQIDKISLNNKLKIDPFSKVSSQVIGSLKINSDSVNTSVSLSSINPLLVAGVAIQVPAIDYTPISQNFSLTAEFQTIKIESGAIDLRLTNNFPSPLILSVKDFMIVDRASGVTIAQSLDPIVIQPRQSKVVSSIPLISDVNMSNSLAMSCKLSLSSSNGQFVVLPSTALVVSAKMKNLVASEVVAKIPQQNPVVINDVVLIEGSLSQPDKFQNIILDSGLLNISITNNLDVDVAVNFSIPNLKNSQNIAFTANQIIPRKSSNVKLFNGLSLKDYSITTLTGPTGIPTNQVNYLATFQTQSTNDYRTIKNTDLVSGYVELSSLVLRRFTGQLKPTVLDQTRNAISMNVKDIQSKLKFTQINLKNPNIQLRLHPTANVEFSVNGRIEARSSSGLMGTMQLNSSTMDKTVISNTDTVITINPQSVSDFFKSFSKLPDSLIVYAGGIANPNYKIVDIQNTDYVTGTGRMEFPFEFGLSGGVYTDSIKVDLSKDERTNIKDVNTLFVSITISNGIAASVQFTGKMYDANNNFLMYFPPKYQDQDTVITVAGATTDASGNVTAANVQNLVVKTNTGESNKIAQAAYMRTRITFNTSNSGNQPVKLKTDDLIKISAFGSTNYHINPKGN